MAPATFSSTEVDDRLAVSLAEAARLLGVHVQTARRAARLGQLRVVEVSGRKLVPRSSIDDLLAGRVGEREVPA